MAASRTIHAGLMCALLLTARVSCRAEETNELRELIRQLQQRVEEQQRTIDSLTQKVQQLDVTPPAEPTRGLSFGNRVIISGEGAAGFFSSGSQGQYPNSNFRIDEAKLFVDAEVMKNVYFYVELNLVQRESGNNSITTGELYLDVENISRFWGKDDQLSLRVGQMDIPFGEEYLMRDAIDNPLIDHSLADFWGVDEGIELYGRFGKASYVVALQNAGVDSLNDFSADKSVAGRISYDPNRWLHLSASGMRTGNVDARKDYFTAMWFGNGYFAAIGPAANEFHVDMVEGDIILTLPRGRVWAYGGYAYFNDNDPTSHDQRDIYFYSVEGVFDVTKKLYGAARFSQIITPNGYPIVGNGDFDEFFYGPLTRNIWRLTLGGGYRFGPDLVWKINYSFEQGTQVGGAVRDHENFFATELAARF